MLKNSRKKYYNNKINYKLHENALQIDELTLPNILILMFAIAPLIGYITITYLDVAFYYFMAAVIYLVLFLMIMDNIELKIPIYIDFY